MKPFRSLAVHLLVASLSAIAVRAYAAPPIVQWQAASGASVYFVQVRSLPVLDIAEEFPAGSAYDPKGFEGVSLLTHTLIKEGSERSSGAELDNRLAAVGAELSSTFDRDRAGYRLRTLSSDRERAQAIDAFAEIMQQPSFPPEAFEREKASLISRTREELTRPARLAERHLFAAMYRDHPYGRERTAESLAAIARDKVTDFYRAQYHAANAIVTLVGDISESEARSIAERITAQLPAGPRSEPLPVVQPDEGTPKIERVALPTEQSHILLGMPALTRGDPDYFALYVGNYVLGGGGFVSRLFRAVREDRGLAYSVASYFAPYAVRGPFVLGLQTERSQTEQALATAQQVLDRFVSQGPSEAELRAAKKAIAGGFALRTDSNRKILNEVAVIGFYRLPLDWLDRFVPSVEKLTAAQIRAAFAIRIDPKRLSGVIVGAPR